MKPPYLPLCMLVYLPSDAPESIVFSKCLIVPRRPLPKWCSFNNWRRLQLNVLISLSEFNKTLLFLFFLFFIPIHVGHHLDLKYGNQLAGASENEIKNIITAPIHPVEPHIWSVCLFFNLPASNVQAKDKRHQLQSFVMVRSLSSHFGTHSYYCPY